MKQAIKWFWINSSSQSSAERWYFYNDAIGITRRNTGWQTSEIGTQVFPICNFEDANNFYVIVAGESKYKFRTQDNLSSVDRTFALVKSKTDGLHINDGWSWVGDVGDGEPAQILGSGGYSNEIKPHIEVGGLTNANITLSGEQTVNGVALVTGNRCLVKDQTTTSQNGVYVVSSGAWTRATDADSSSELQNLIVLFVHPSNKTLTRFYYQTAQNPVVGTDPITFVLYEWNCAQNFLGTVLPKDGGGYVGIYAANGPIVSAAYSIGTVEGSSISTLVRSSRTPLLTGTSGGIHPRMVRIGSTLHIFIHNFTTLGTEGRIYRVMHWTTPWDDNPANWSLSLVKADLFNGTGIIQDGTLLAILGNLGQPWYEDGVYKFLSTVTPKSYPANQSKVTQSGVQGVIKQYSTTDFSTFTEDKTLFTDGQLAGIGVNALAGQMIYNGKKFMPVVHYKWQGKATLTSESEPMTNVKLLTTSEPVNGETVHVNGEVWPLALKAGGLIRVDQPQEASLSPLDVLPKTALDIVGSPTRAFYSSIQAATGVYLKRSGNIITNPNKFAFKCRYNNITSDTDTYVIAALIRASDGKVVFKLENSTFRYRVTVGDGATKSKTYRVSTLMTSLPNATNIYADGLVPLGFLWDNGTLTLLAGYENSLTLDTSSPNDTFTDLGMIGDELRIGAGPNPSTDFCQYIQQSAMWLNGDDATFENWLNLDVI